MSVASDTSPAHFTGLLALFVFLTACSPHVPIPEDVLVIGQVAEPRSLDPHVTTTSNDFRILSSIFEGLVRFRPGTLEIVPALAKTWTVSESGTHFHFELRENVVFHDGTPFDATTVKFTFERMLDDQHPYHHTGPFPLAFFFSLVDRIEADGRHDVHFYLKQPYAPFLSNLAYPSGFIVSPAAIARWGKDSGRNPVGTGPFRFERWDRHWRVILRAHELYWAEPPRLAALIFQPIGDVNARSTQMLAGNLDIMLEPPPELLGIFDRELAVEGRAGPHLWFVILNCAVPPFDDVRMRRALNHAVNKAALIDQVLHGSAAIAVGPIPQAFHWATDPEFDPYPYDPARARRLIAQSGYDGEPLLFYVPEGGSGMLAPIAMATAIQADLKAVGIKVAIQTFEWNTYLAKVNAGLPDEVHMAEMAWMVNDPDTLPYLSLHRDAWPEQGGFNSGYYANPQIDSLLGRARRTYDRTARGALYRKINRLVAYDAPWLFVASAKQMAVRQAYVRDFHLEPSLLLSLHSTYKQPRRARAP